ncbi:heme-binding protein [Novosphingobium flavum]|uniref:Heme-binding protein n=1 Tax=Novosphingobium flavum TaxID=1778672 RepID=A0A7X1FR15_9SPHN|nr:heme-binding protein [Novosphingobium flavum]MBC2665395.1 heme-binding protein [Novosphingobium flavum]
MRRHFTAPVSLIMLSLVPALAAAQSPPPAATAPRAADPVIAANLITRDEALGLVRDSVMACDKRGERAAAVVTDVNGVMRAAVSTEGGNTIGLTSTARKTAAVLRFRMSTRALREKAAADAAFAAEFGKDERYYFSPGGLPLFRGGQFVAVLAVGGGHAIDEECALDALSRTQWKTAAN